ncbi:MULTISPECIES: cardiolipin synthase ClsB [unclassified Pseudomonas]|uniref:cardiolipin synthase ClsB n=1 Tax=unclassified Pseudomonas TaxID=196821 RepID=UPI002B22602F|nr:MULTISPECIES: cardiolipin synthase ClsB [unclassified Pseudomonas]MEA9979490.1 cardiolipin synthase ClsB [Pseudomonas sp. RTS4]MEB0199656.1 cardiolipin synthase ClsB [Pseudomonas sp. 5S4]MEB0247059.1 cardiolipin synthase ClsB [Pseudomonas sp. 10S5]
MKLSCAQYQWRDGNSAQLLINGEDFFAQVVDCIRAARKEVLLETFIIVQDRVGEALQQALIEAALRGVRVVLTMDDYGTSDLNPEFLAQLLRAGVRVELFGQRSQMLGKRTQLFYRLHRKIVVIDAELALIGSPNYSLDHMSDTGPTAKQDYALLVRGPVVADIYQSSLSLVRSATRGAMRPLHVVQHQTGSARMLLAVRDNTEHTADIEEQYMLAIRNANQRVTIANACFFPSYRFLRELRNAARRGVKVNLILQGQPDLPLVRMCSRMLYAYLLREGVILHEFTQRVLHGNVALIDQEWSTVGSSNLDPLSLSLNLEANLFIRDQALNQKLHKHLRELMLTQCRQVTLQQARRREWWRAPLIFLCFHFLRHFPAVAGLLPAHALRLKPLSVAGSAVESAPQVRQDDREESL